MNRPAAVAFGEVQRSLTLFAQGIAGRPVQLQPVPTIGIAARLPSFSGPAMVVRLPAQIDRFAQREHNRGAYRVAVLHQIGYFENGSFDLAPDLGHRFASAPRPALLRRVFVALEDLRVDAALLRRYPGARPDMQRAFADALSRRPPCATLQPAAAMVEALVQFSLGAPRATLLRAAPDRALREALDLAALLRRVSATVDDSARAALHVCALLEWPNRPLRRRGATASPAAGADVPDVEAGVEAGVETDAYADEGAAPMVECRGDSLADRVARAGLAQRGLAPQAASPQHDAPDAVVKAQRATASATAATTHAQRLSDAEASAHYVDEWDYQQQCYLKSWCRVVEQRLQGDDHGFMDDIRRRHATLARQVKRQFALLRPESWRRVHRTDDGDELDLEAVIQARIEARAGRPGDDRAYVRRDRALRDVAAVLLLDTSASTDHPLSVPAPPDAAPRAQEPVAEQEAVDYLYGRYTLADVAPSPPPPPKRRVIDIAKEALAVMCDALHRLGDSHALYGFSGAGRDCVEFHVAKDFGEAPSARTAAALAAMQPRGATRMGAAVRHATARLARQPQRLKVLIVVSDGYPQDQDYGPDPRDEEYGLQDSARALQEAERAGVSTFCLTIDPAGHDYLRHMCPPRRYRVIDDVRQLPRALSQVYRSLTSARPA